MRVTKIRRGGFVSTRRCPAGRVILRIPPRKLQSFCNKHGYGDYDTCKGTHRSGLIHSSDYEITSIYNAELRGFATYYRLDTRVRTRLTRLAWVASQSLMRTLAAKHRTRVGVILRKLRRPDGRHVVWHPGKGGRKLEVTVWRPKEGLVEDTRENHPQAEAAAQFDGVHKGLPFWTAKARLYLVEKVLFSMGNWQNHLWTAW